MQEYQFVNEPAEVPEEEAKEIRPAKRRRLTGEAYVAVVQIILCGGLLLFAWGSKQVGGRVYEGFSRGYQRLARMQVDWNELLHQYEKAEAPSEDTQGTEKEVDAVSSSEE